MNAMNTILARWKNLLPNWLFFEKNCLEFFLLRIQYFSVNFAWINFRKRKSLKINPRDNKGVELKIACLASFGMSALYDTFFQASGVPEINGVRHILTRFLGVRPH